MTKARVIAAYLPQFHPIPENDKWWGKGFTEWTNVTKAKPLFKEHYQPHLPTESGFYDLRLKESRLNQEKLAKEHGIYGFCYYHYWFDGKQILDMPIKSKLQNPDEDLPFMLCWANENWTRKWDGGNNEILLQQNYSRTDSVKFAKHLIPYFQDKRYIRKNGKVLFSIYRSDIIPNVTEYIEEIRKEAIKYGIEVEISRFESFGNAGVEFMNGFDSAVEFQPFSEQLTKFRSKILQPRYNKKLIRRVLLKVLEKIGFPHQRKKFIWKNFDKLNYKEYVSFIEQNYSISKDYLRYPGITPSWDNTARRKEYESFLFINSEPDEFNRWLNFLVKKIKESNKSELNGIIFINAWNEWAEGNHLEPCIKYNKSFLEKIKIQNEI
jgi:hypothetical protein